MCGKYMGEDYQNRDFIIVGYFLSRYGEMINEKTGEMKSVPPSELETQKWDEAYDLFFLKLGNGRDLATFRNSLRNTRDEFDYFLPEVTTRIGHKKKNLPPLRESVLNQMEDKSRDDVWSYVSQFARDFQELDISSDLDAMDFSNSDSVATSKEGRTKFRISRTRERDPRLRKKAIEIHGLNCKACDFNFGEVYGEWGEGFIEIHHSTPISDYSDEGSETNPTEDLIPLCSNCHRMVHRKRDKLLSLEELKAMINRND
jgi:5-methylcytosine-specific restriction endonuclease McrA